MREEEGKLANFYSNSLGANKETIEGLMKVETRMDLSQSKSIGFVNANSNQYRAVASIKLNDMNDKQTSLLKDIKSLITKVVKGEEVKAAVITLEDGSSVYIDSEDGEFVGKSIFLEEGGEPLADGTYKLEDARELIVADGMVSEIVEGEPSEDPADAEALAAENEALKAEIETLKAAAIEGASALEESNKVNAEMKASIEVINEKVNALSIENEAMASVTVGGKEAVKAAVKTSLSNKSNDMASFLKGTYKK